MTVQYSPDKHFNAKWHLWIEIMIFVSSLSHYFGIKTFCRFIGVYRNTRHPIVKIQFVRVNSHNTLTKRQRKNDLHQNLRKKGRKRNQRRELRKRTKTKINQFYIHDFCVVKYAIGQSISNRRVAQQNQ